VHFLPAQAAQIPQSDYAARRAALAKAIGNGIVVAFGAPEPEEDFIAFNQNSPFNYLTGFAEPNAALVFEVRNGQVAGKGEAVRRGERPCARSLDRCATGTARRSAHTRTRGA
jgi:hypothetical protein